MIRTLTIVTSVITATAALGVSQPLAAGDKAKVTKRDCMRMVRHMPRDDVAFKGGVDVHGRKVAGANLNNPSPIKVPKEIVIDLGIDIAEKYDLGKKGTGYSATTQTFGKISVDPLSGAVKYNGQPLDGADKAAIAKACRQMYGRK